MNQRKDRQFAPRKEKLNVQNGRFLKLIDEAKKAPYYEKHLEGLSIESLDDLTKLPVFTQNQYRKKMYPATKDLNTCALKGGVVLRSGGTSGNPKFSVYSKEDWQNMVDHSLPLLETLGIHPGDRVANCLIAGNLYGGLISLEHELFALGATSLPFGSSTNSLEFIKTCRSFEVNALVGIPSIIIPLLREAKSIDNKFSIETIVFGGQSMTTTDQSWLRNEFGAKRISSILAANDGGQFGYQCEKMSGALHHVDEEFNKIEILDDNDNPVEPGQPGRIVITALTKYTLPLIRYELGDVGRMVEAPCSCGRTDRVLEFLGRSKDSFILGGNTMQVSQFKEALHDVDVSELQLVVSSDKGRDNIEIKVGSKSIPSSDAIENQLRQNLAAFDEPPEENSFSFKIHSLGLGEIERQNVSKKIIELIDLRK